MERGRGGGGVCVELGSGGSPLVYRGQLCECCPCIYINPSLAGLIVDGVCWLSC